MMYPHIPTQKIFGITMTQNNIFKNDIYTCMKNQNKVIYQNTIYLTLHAKIKTNYMNFSSVNKFVISKCNDQNIK